MMSNTWIRLTGAGRRSAIIGAVLAGVAAFLAVGAAEAANKTLTVGIEQEPTGFDAVKGRVLGEAPASVMLTMVDRLMAYDADGKLKGELAESMTASEDGLTYIFKLRKGVKFHDGSDFTADDVVTHYNRVLDPASKYVGLMFISPIKGAEKVDDHTVRINLKHPWQPMRDGLSAFALCCFIPSAKAVAADTMNRQPVGTGPYRFKEWRGGDKIVVERNPNYWNKDAKVHFDEIVFKVLPDQQTRQAALQSGEIDVHWTDRGHSIVQAKSDPKLTVYSRNGEGGGILFLNNSKPPLDDVRVRRALSMAWDQKYYVESQLQNTQLVTKTGFDDEGKCDSGYLGDAKFAEAKKLVAEIGKPIEVELMHTATQRGREYGLLWQQLAKRAGITMKLKPMDQVAFIGNVFKNDYQMAGWRIADAGDIGPQLFALLQSKSPYNLAHYADPEMDKLLVTMRTAPTPEKRKTAMCSVVRKMNQDAPILWASGRTHNAIAKKGLKGLRPLYQGVVDVRFAWFD
ncbi:MAG: ABC transporter substrate-binding protein [Reyranella sp.]|uniref:ABC transporter substrate-binding protein n=1 Tax=Reyranella sp. TaxID=1929291 RepID=UPI003D10763D